MNEYPAQIRTDVRKLRHQGVDYAAPDGSEGWTVSLRKDSATLLLNGNSKCAFSNAALYCNGKYVASCGPMPGRQFSFRMRDALGALPEHVILQVKCDGRLVPYAGKHSGWRVSKRFQSNGKALLDIEEKLSNGLLLNKKGHFVPDSMSAEFEDGCFRVYTALSEFFETAYKYPVMVTHGTLLGLVREGRLIPFDDDFDCAYVSANRDVRAVASERGRILHDLKKVGFNVKRGTSGQIKVRRYGVEIDFLPAWRSEEGRFCIAGFTSMAMPLEAIYPLSSLPFRDGAVKAFARPELFLEHQYGPNWRIPDPGYRSILSSEARQNLEVLRWEQPD